MVDTGGCVVDTEGCVVVLETMQCVKSALLTIFVLQMFFYSFIIKCKFSIIVSSLLWLDCSSVSYGACLLA